MIMGNWLGSMEAPVYCSNTDQNKRTLSTTEIIDHILPYTKEDRQCGMKKAKKAKARVEMMQLINDYKDGKAVELPEEVKRLI
jgi:hypothetical protein